MQGAHSLTAATNTSTICMHVCLCRRLNPTRPLIVAAYCTLVCGVWAVSLAVPFWAWLLIDGAVIVAWQQIAERVKAVANTAAARGGRCASVTFASATFASVILLSVTFVNTFKMRRYAVLVLCLS
jgi:hypothetical protein